MAMLASCSSGSANAATSDGTATTSGDVVTSTMQEKARTVITTDGGAHNLKHYQRVAVTVA